MSSRYRTAPAPTADLPTGIPYILSNEVAERFSYYGMRTILFIFMTRYLMDADGELAAMGPEDAKAWYHTFSSAVYFTPLLGALLSDVFLGKYRTILSLSLVYCLGHLALALDETRVGLTLGLTLIAIGSGGIKPCVSAHVGDQFGSSNAHRLPDAFSYFYFGINLGAFVSTLLTPVLLDRFGPHVAFGVPGVLMALATFVFWLGRHRFIHIPPGGKKFAEELFSAEGLGAILRLGVVYVFVAMFWSLFDQTGSAWVQQAEQMDRVFLGIEWLPSQFQAINPILIMTFIPLFNFVLYPRLAKQFALTPLRKIGAGLFLTVGSYLVMALAQSLIDAGQTPSIAWQLFAYVILTAAEVLVSITCLEFSYTQAPKNLKSIVMAFFLMSVSVGNLFTAGVNFFIQNPDGSSKLVGSEYYLFFAGAMAVTAVLYVPVAMRFTERTYIQDEAPADGAPAPA